MSTITDAQRAAILDLVKHMHLPSGLGSREEACSVAAINLALDGTLTADIPDCMSPVVGRWIIGVQDAMPDELRNSGAAGAAGAARAAEHRRAWDDFDPCALLEQLIAIGDNQ